jgi:hypothetical protein
MTDPVELDPRLEQLLGDGPAPEGWSEVAALLRQAADIEPNGAPAPHLLAALVAAATEPEAPGRRVVARRTIGIAAAAAAVVLGAGSAAAAGGDLPDPVQAVVHDVVGAVGLHVPDSGGSQDGPGHGRSDEAPGRPEVPGQPADPGRSDEAPGRPEDPGRSEDAPGQDPAREPGPPEDLPAELPAQAEDTGAPEDPGPPETVPSTVPTQPSPPTSVTPPSTGGADASEDTPGDGQGQGGERSSSARQTD